MAQFRLKIVIEQRLSVTYAWLEEYRRAKTYVNQNLSGRLFVAAIMIYCTKIKTADGIKIAC